MGMRLFGEEVSEGQLWRQWYLRERAVAGRMGGAGGPPGAAARIGPTSAVE